MKCIIKALSTFFYLGYMPLIPGTFGSLGGLALYFLLKGNNCVYIPVTFLIIIIGFLVSAKAEEIFRRKDARYIVIDEVAGMLISFMFVPYQPELVIIGFLLFRLLDTVKPYPASDLQKIKGSFGVMSDDIVAALYTNLVLQVVCRFASFKTL